jgi:hypothetical protein
MVTVIDLPTQQTISGAEANVMHQSLTIHALRPSFAMTGSAFELGLASDRLDLITEDPIK